MSVKTRTPDLLYGIQRRRRCPAHSLSVASTSRNPSRDYRALFFHCYSSILQLQNFNICPLSVRHCNSNSNDNDSGVSVHPDPQRTYKTLCFSTHALHLHPRASPEDWTNQKKSRDTTIEGLCRPNTKHEYFFCQATGRTGGGELGGLYADHVRNGLRHSEGDTNTPATKQALHCGLDCQRVLPMMTDSDSNGPPSSSSLFTLLLFIMISSNQSLQGLRCRLAFEEKVA